MSVCPEQRLSDEHRLARTVIYSRERAKVGTTRGKIAVLNKVRMKCKLENFSRIQRIKELIERLMKKEERLEKLLTTNSLYEKAECLQPGTYHQDFQTIFSKQTLDVCVEENNADIFASKLEGRLPTKEEISYEKIKRWLPPIILFVKDCSIDDVKMTMAEYKNQTPSQYPTAYIFCVEKEMEQLLYTDLNTEVNDALIVTLDSKELRRAVTIAYEGFFSLVLHECATSLAIVEETISRMSKVHKSETLDLFECAVRLMYEIRSDSETIQKTMLSRKKFEKSGRRHLPVEVTNQLDMLKKDGVIGYGHFSGQLKVDIDNVGTESEMSKLKSKIHQLFDTRGIKAEIRESTLQRNLFVSPGDKLYINSGTPDRYGTIGAFAKYGSQTAALTCHHVVMGEREPHVVINNEREGLGTVAFYNTKYDFAGIKIDNARVKIDKMKNKEGVPFNSSLYRGRDEDLTNTQVFKRGASSDVTEGKIHCSDYRCLSPEVISDTVLVKGIDDSAFLLPGDSGSVVYRIDPDDPDDGNIQLISMCQGSEIRSRVDEVDSSLALSYRLETPVDKASEEIGEKLTFE